MPDGLVFYYGFLFSKQDALLLAPLVWDSLEVFCRHKP